MSLGGETPIFGEGLEISSTVGLRGTPKVKSYPRSVSNLGPHQPTSLFGVVKGKILTLSESPKVSLGANTPDVRMASHQDLKSLAERSGSQ